MAVNNQFPIPEAPQVPTFSEYKPYEKPFPEADIPTLGAGAPFPEMGEIPTYQPTTEQYPITQLPTYRPTGEAYPEYAKPETGGVGEALQQTILSRMAGEGTAGAESAIYERAEVSMERQHQEGLQRIDEEMASRGLTGSGIHGDAVRKLEEERQRSMADLSRQVTIYGQQAIESAMGRGAQYVEQQAAEAARELQTRERGYAARVNESIRKYESEARAAEARGASDVAAYQTGIAERIRAYESQARASTAKNEMSAAKWTAEYNVHMNRYQANLAKASALETRKVQAWQIGQSEYTKTYEAEYRTTADRWQAEQAAYAAGVNKAQTEWQRAQTEIETQFRERQFDWQKEQQGLATYGQRERIKEQEFEKYKKGKRPFFISPGTAGYGDWVKWERELREEFEKQYESPWQTGGQ